MLERHHALSTGSTLTARLSRSADSAGLSISYNAQPVISSTRPRRMDESVNRDTSGTLRYSPRVTAMARASYSSLAKSRRRSRSVEPGVYICNCGFGNFNNLGQGDLFVEHLRCGKDWRWTFILSSPRITGIGRRGHCIRLWFGGVELLL